jgi:hypothetical protein
VIAVAASVDLFVAAARGARPRCLARRHQRRGKIRRSSPGSTGSAPASAPASCNEPRRFDRRDHRPDMRRRSARRRRCYVPLRLARRDQFLRRTRAFGIGALGRAGASQRPYGLHPTIANPRPPEIGPIRVRRQVPASPSRLYSDPSYTIRRPSRSSYASSMRSLAVEDRRLERREPVAAARRGASMSAPAAEQRAPPDVACDAAGAPPG